MNRNKGFTLIELLIVIAMSAIMITIAASVGKGWSKRSSFDSAIKELRENIFNSKIQAASENRFIKFEFESTNAFGGQGIKYTASIQNKFVNPWEDDAAWEKIPAITDVTMSSKYDMLSPKDNLPGNFAVSPGGEIYQYPVGQTSAPVKIEFLIKLYEDLAAEETVYETQFIIHPWGGTKIESKKPAYNK